MIAGPVKPVAGLDLLYGQPMETPAHQLSAIERRILGALAAGDQDAVPPDWVAIERLKAFGFIELTLSGRPTITLEGKKANAQRP